MALVLVALVSLGIVGGVEFYRSPLMVDGSYYLVNLYHGSESIVVSNGNVMVVSEEGGSSYLGCCYYDSKRGWMYQDYYGNEAALHPGIREMRVEEIPARGGGHPGRSVRYVRQVYLESAYEALMLKDRLTRFLGL